MQDKSTQVRDLSTSPTSQVEKDCVISHDTCNPEEEVIKSFNQQSDYRIPNLTAGDLVGSLIAFFCLTLLRFDYFYTQAVSGVCQGPQIRSISSSDPALCLSAERACYVYRIPTNRRPGRMPAHNFWSPSALPVHQR